MSYRGRTSVIADATLSLRWLAARRSPFTVLDFAADMEMCKRSAWRWLVSLEGTGAVERVGRNREMRGSPTLFASRIRCDGCCEAAASAPRWVAGERGDG